MVRAHQHAAGARRARPRTSPQGASPNDKNPPAEPGREALGRSLGGLSTEIHLARKALPPAGPDPQPRPARRLPRFIPLMQTIRITRRGTWRPRTRPGTVIGDKAYSSRYYKRELIYQGTVDLASIRIWLRDPVP